MSRTVPEAFSIRRSAVDRRADGAARTIHVTNTTVLIERSVDGVRMRIGVPIAAYRDLVICVRPPSDRATLKLRHADGDLDVVIGNGSARDVATSARAWSSLTGKPVAIEEACVRIDGTFARRRTRTKPMRRSRFARRRAAGDTARLVTRFGGEREIIARS